MSQTKLFEYRSIDAEGKRAKGKVEAQNEAAATQLLRQQGIVPLSITEPNQLLNKNLSIPGFGPRTKLKDLAIFARQFSTMTSSGMSLIRSLTVLEEQAEKGPLKKAVSQIRTDVEQGLSLSQSMGRHRLFPPLMVAMIRAGETGGFLDGALERIAGNLEKDSALRAKIKSALTYPAVVMVFTVLLITGVLIFIVPTFEQMFTQLGSQLPMPTQILVTTSNSLVWSGPLAIVVITVGTSAFKRAMRANHGLRVRFDRLKLRLPVFGNLFTKMSISRFSRNLSTLLEVGVPVMQALDVVGETIGNAFVADMMKDLQEAVRDGLPMSAPLRDSPIFPQMVRQMIEVGEESGQISQMLDKIADFYDREVDAAADALTASIEPVMVLLMGGVVGAMVICLYLPMFTVYQHVEGAT